MPPVTELENLLAGSVPFSVIALAAGIALLWGGAEAVTRSLGPVARRFGVSELIVTILGVSVLSSLPELSLSMAAGLEGQADISIGNVVGSNFVTLTFVTALCALVSPIAVTQGIKERESSWMILSSAVVLVLAVDGTVSRIDGVLLVALYLPYLASVLAEARAEARRSRAAGLLDTPEARRRIWPFTLLILAGIAAIVAGAEVALIGGQSLGHLAGISPLVLGALIFALGTSLPELAIALSATLKKKAAVTIGEIYASNIFTALVVLGLCAIARPIEGFSKQVLQFDLPLLILGGVMIQIFLNTGNRLVRLEALAIMGLYLFFVAGHFLPVGLSF
jgi:cation:H+ antiporter